MAARSDPALAEAVIRLDREFMAASEDVFRELFADEIAAAPEVGRAGLGLLYSLMSGLALARQIPGYEPARAEDILTAFKTLVRTALRTSTGRPHRTEVTTMATPDTIAADRAWLSLLDRLNRQSVTSTSTPTPTSTGTARSWHSTRKTPAGSCPPTIRSAGPPGTGRCPPPPGPGSAASWSRAR